MNFLLTEEKLRKGVLYSFHILFFVTPLLVSLHSYELFEFPKMVFVYLMTIVIVALWLLRMIATRSLLFARTTLDIPILLYLGAVILTTIFSIDRHLSIFGYYSRFNGGLLSWLCYSLLYFAFVANVELRGARVERLGTSKEKEDSCLPAGKAGQVVDAQLGTSMTNQELQPTTYPLFAEKLCLQPLLPFLRTILLAGTIVAIYAILERLGIDRNFWQEDVQARVFSTFGQPNWLAGYLGMLVPVSVGLFLVAKSRNGRLLLYAVFCILYVGFTFTYSRGGFTGLAVGLLLLALLLIRFFWQHKKTALATAAIPILVFILFGNAFTRDNGYKGLINHYYPPYMTPSNTQFTSSSDIRKIIWQGALQVFIHHPIIGTGNETFADTYYWFRPKAHNQTTEWDLLYNKAHNEYLNELATKGLVGFVPYLLLLGSMVVVPFLGKRVKNYELGIRGKTNPKKPFSAKSLILRSLLFIHMPSDPQRQVLDIIKISLIAGIISYLLQNFFGFSVVFINVLLYLFSAFLMVLTDKVTQHRIEVSAIGKPLVRITSLLGTLGLAFYTSFLLYGMWFGDKAFATGYHDVYNGYPAKAYKSFLEARVHNNNEPMYQVYFGFAAAHTAVVALDRGDASTSAMMTEDARESLLHVQEHSPNNLYLLRLVARGYQQLIKIDPSYGDKALASAQFIVNHSPTDPQDQLRLAEILAATDKLTEAKTVYLATMELKPDWPDAPKKYAQFLLDNRAYANLATESDVTFSINHLLPFASDPDIVAIIASFSAKSAVQP